MNLAIANGEDLVGEIAPWLEENRTLPALEFLRQRLIQVRSRISPSKWADYCSENFSPKKSQPGAVTRLLETVPLGSGPAGVARGLLHESLVLDVVYGCPPHVQTSPTQQIEDLWNWELQLGFCKTLRSRLTFLSRELYELASTLPAPKILALGCGHLREATQSLNRPSMKEGRIVALDRDRASLDFISCEYAHPESITLLGSWRDLLTNTEPSSFDFVYIPTMFDKMDDRKAAGLLACALKFLKPGGRLIAANFTPELEDAAYLEACLDWWPCYRTEEELAGLLDVETSKTLRGQAVFRDETGGAAFLDLQTL